MPTGRHPPTNPEPIKSLGQVVSVPPLPTSPAPCRSARRWCSRCARPCWKVARNQGVRQPVSGSPRETTTTHHPGLPLFAAQVPGGFHAPRSALPSGVVGICRQRPCNIRKPSSFQMVTKKPAIQARRCPPAGGQNSYTFRPSRGSQPPCTQKKIPMAFQQLIRVSTIFVRVGTNTALATRQATTTTAGGKVQQTHRNRRPR